MGLAYAATTPAAVKWFGAHQRGLIVGLVVGVILIVGGLTFFPALALGPLVEHFSMRVGTLF